MNNKIKSTLMGITMVAITACSGGTSSSVTEALFSSSNPNNEQIIDDYADVVIVPTYELLHTRLVSLENAIISFEDDKTEDNLELVRLAWAQARTPWELSEAFLFGPVDSNGYDPALDSWPVDSTVLKSILDGSDELTEDFVENSDPTVKGFHTLEYLIFGNRTSVDETKESTSFTDREFQYMKALIAEMIDVSQALVSSWTDGTSSYSSIIKNAGNNSIYPSLQSAGEEIVRGMITILDEVANGKIATPFDARDPNLVESQFSFNSIEDFQNNIRGVKNVYMGDLNETSTTGAGLNEFIYEIDPALDAQIQGELDTAIEAIGNIPSPFRDAITNPDYDDEILNAQQAVQQIHDTIYNSVLPLFTH